MPPPTPWVEFEWRGTLPAPPIGGLLVRQNCLLPQGPSAGVVRHPSQNEAAAYLQNIRPIITTFDTYTHTDALNSHTGYGVSGYFQLATIEVFFLKKPLKMPPRTASGRISRERFKRGSRNFENLSPTIGPTKVTDKNITSCFRSVVKLD